MEAKSGYLNTTHDQRVIAKYSLLTGFEDKIDRDLVMIGWDHVMDMEGSLEDPESVSFDLVNCSKIGEYNTEAAADMIHEGVVEALRFLRSKGD